VTSLSKIKKYLYKSLQRENIRGEKLRRDSFRLRHDHTI
jgi:hypothetical protein